MAGKGCRAGSGALTVLKPEPCWYGPCVSMISPTNTVSDGGQKWEQNINKVAFRALNGIALKRFAVRQAFDDVERAAVEHSQAASGPDGDILVSNQEALIDRARVDDATSEQGAGPGAHDRRPTGAGGVAENAGRADANGRAAPGAAGGDRPGVDQRQRLPNRRAARESKLAQSGAL